MGCHNVWMRPRIEITNSKKDRQEENRQDWQSATTCLQEAPNGKSPAAARQMMQHRDSHAAQSQPQPEEISEKIREKKLPAAEKCAGDTGAEGCYSGTARDPLDPIQLRSQLSAHCSSASNFLLSSAG